MSESLYLTHKLGQGITPSHFMKSMNSREMVNSGIPDTKEKLTSLYDHFEWPDQDDREAIGSLNERNDLRVLILATDWCPDVIWNVPVLVRAMEHARIPTEILIMDEHLETMDHFLTNGGRAQPIAVFLSDSGEVLGRWGARPAYIQAVMDRFKEENPDRKAAGYQDKLNETYRAIGSLYRCVSDYQRALIQELRACLESIQSERSSR
ncbi:thioredoxin family protein [Cohnella sp. AR92]|uniref:thioredoxin family protein n=1 Tax=Cohnella sp. AR92 TaxID=648716 RepID=UPI000F8CA08B|nr:thioredoxin family protein [Cohnella sp. AR92]RUS43954.1 thioredoxin family protein [Cohnella sp. AR92]